MVLSERSLGEVTCFLGMPPSRAHDGPYEGLSHETMRRRLQRTGQPHIQDAVYKKKHVSPSNWTETSFSERKVNRPKMAPNSFF